MDNLVKLAKEFIKKERIHGLPQVSESDRPNPSLNSDETLGKEKEKDIPAEWPLKPGWQVVWRDRKGVLKDGIVQRMESSSSGWMVYLETGQAIPSRIISAVGRIENGKKVAAWLVKPHGLTGPSPDDWQTAWRRVAILTKRIEEGDSRFTAILEILEHCDHAFEKGDYLAFYELSRRLEALMKGS